jgi:Domain of unknown function (DUF929)
MANKKLSNSQTGLIERPHPQRAGTHTSNKSEALRIARDTRAIERRQQARREERWERLKPVLGTVGIVIAAIIIFFTMRIGPSSANADIGQLAPPAVVTGVTQVNPQTFATVQTGGITNPLVAIPNTPVLVDAMGKPEVVYIGAEYCPYCAAQRWSAIIALSRFGTFQGLHLTTSSSTDVYADTATFTFVGNSYTSQYVNFLPTEIQDRDQNPLQSLTADDQALLNKYDAAPYSQSPGGIPFLDIGNQQIAFGSGINPQLLTGLSWQQIATDLSIPSNALTQQIVGNANYLTAAICQATGQKPASVCQAAPIPTISQQLGK